MMSDEVNENVDRDELHDRLIDRGLREVLGGEKPSQLAERILAAAGAATAAATPKVERLVADVGTPEWGRFARLQLTLAIVLLIGVGLGLLLFVPFRYDLRDLARRGEPAQAPAPTSAPAASADVTDLTTEYKLSYAAAGTDGERRPEVVGENRKNELEAEEKSLKDLSDSDGATPATLSTLSVSSSAGTTRYSEGGTYAAPALAGGRGGATVFNRQLDAIDAEERPLVRGNEPFGLSAPSLGKEAAAQSGEGQGQTSAGAAGASAPVVANEHWAWAEPSELGDEARRREQDLGRVAADDALAAASIPTPESEGMQRGLALGVIPSNDRYYRQIANGEADKLSEVVREEALVDGVQLDDYQLNLERGRGPQAGGDQYTPIVDNPFHAISAATTDNRLSTFSIDVDTASYANVRQFLMDSSTLPPPDAVRIEELVNYFDYDYSAPTGDVPFASNVEVAACPWKPEHRLVRVGIKGREMQSTARPKSNLVFLVDVSGSMDEPNKLPLVLEGLRMLTRKLGENDRIAIVVYASSEGLVLESTRGDQQQVILDALNRLSAGGSTAGGAGIVLAYKLAEENFIKDGVNRVILCTDGDFNVGVTSTGDLQRLAEEKAKDTGVFLTVLGFGRGNLNDAMMEAIADHGNGNYHYVDNRKEARKVLVEEMTGTLVTIAKDVKIQIEFNPSAVAGYRLIGYENRVLAAEDFNDDKKDAGEIGAGHTVTALYEIVPAGQKVDATSVDALKYGPVTKSGEEAASPATGADAELVKGEDAPAAADEETATNAGELLTLKIRYKQPDGDVSSKLEFPITDNGQAFSEATADFQFASAVAGFGMLLRGSPYKGDASFAGMLEIAESASRDRDERGYRGEFCDMIRRAKELAGE